MIDDPSISNVNSYETRESRPRLLLFFLLLPLISISPQDFISSVVVLIAEPSSRDPMVESTTSGSSSDTNGPVCAQLLTQLNTAYQHLAPDAQALVSIRRKIAGNVIPCSWGKERCVSRDKPRWDRYGEMYRYRGCQTLGANCVSILNVNDTPEMGVSTWFTSGNWELFRGNISHCVIMQYNIIYMI